MGEKGMKWLCFMEMIKKLFFCICYYQESKAVTWVHWINIAEWIKLHLLKFKILLSCKLKENYQAGLHVQQHHKQTKIYVVAKKGVLCHRRTILSTLKTKLPYFLETDRSELMWNFILLHNFDINLLNWFLENIFCLLSVK